MSHETEQLRKEVAALREKLAMVMDRVGIRMDMGEDPEYRIAMDHAALGNPKLIQDYLRRKHKNEGMQA